MISTRWCRLTTWLCGFRPKRKIRKCNVTVQSWQQTTFRIWQYGWSTAYIQKTFKSWGTKNGSIWDRHDVGYAGWLKVFQRKGLSKDQYFGKGLSKYQYFQKLHEYWGEYCPWHNPKTPLKKIYRCDNLFTVVRDPYTRMLSEFNRPWVGYKSGNGTHGRPITSFTLNSWVQRGTRRKEGLSTLVILFMDNPTALQCRFEL